MYTRKKERHTQIWKLFRQYWNFHTHSSHRGEEEEEKTETITKSKCSYFHYPTSYNRRVVCAKHWFVWLRCSCQCQTCDHLLIAVKLSVQIENGENLAIHKSHESSAICNLLALSVSYLLLWLLLYVVLFTDNICFADRNNLNRLNCLNHVPFFDSSRLFRFHCK